MVPQGSEKIAMMVVDQVDSMLAYWDCDLRCRFANAAYKFWFGNGRKELLGITMQEMLGPLYEFSRPQIEAALRGEPQHFERNIVLAEDEIRYTLVSYYPDMEAGQVKGFSVQVVDVTKMKRLELELIESKRQAEKQATHDFLTGLPNRVLLMDRIAAGIARASRSEKSLAVVAIDLDDFKGVNDCYGHDAGDIVLQEVAARMRRVIRASDTVTRLGGDEFIYLAENIDRDELAETLHRMKRYVSQPFVYRGLTLCPLMSCGVAFYPDQGRTPRQLMLEADSALYMAKTKGKNQWVISDTQVFITA